MSAFAVQNPWMFFFLYIATLITVLLVANEIGTAIKYVKRGAAPPAAHKET
jgi:hypothetical protein